MAWVLADLKALVGRKLGILASAETLSAEDAIVIGSGIDRAFNDLTARSIIPGSQSTFTTATIPDALGEGFANMAAGLVAVEFGKPYDYGRMLALDGEIAIRRICAVKYEPPVDADEPVVGDDDYTGTTEAQYF